MISALVIGMAMAFWAPYGEPSCTPVIHYNAVMPTDEMAYTYVGDEGCNIWVSRELARDRDIEDQCSYVAHELGHIRGLDHSDDPRNVMYPMPAIPRACRMKFRP